MNQNKLSNILKIEGTKNIFLALLLSITFYIVYVVAFEYSSSSLSFKKHNEIKANYEIAKTFYDKGEYEASLKYIYPIIYTKSNSYSIKAIKLLANMYENGHGVEKNILKAKKLYLESSKDYINTNLDLPRSMFSYDYFNKILGFTFLLLLIIVGRESRLLVLIATPFAILIYNPLFEYNILHQELINTYYFNSYFRGFLLPLLLIISPTTARKIFINIFRFMEIIDRENVLNKVENKDIYLLNLLIDSNQFIRRVSNEDTITTKDNFKNILIPKIERIEIEKECLANIFQSAIKKDYSLNAKSQEGLNLLALALYFKNYEIVKLLVENGFDVNEKVTIKSDYNIFEKIEDKDSLGLVFEESCDVYPIEIAVRHCNIDIIKLLLKHGAQPVKNNIYDLFAGTRQENGWSTIELIGAIGDADLIKHLLDNGYKNNIDELLQPATDNSKYEACKVLLEYRDTSSPLVTHLSSLIIDKNIELLKLFVEHGVILDEKECINLNEEFENRKSYLTLCIEGKDKVEDQITYYEIAQYLIENGVDINYKNPLINTLKHKWKTMDESYNRMDHKMFYLLADNGADIHYVDENTGETILMAVCKSSYFMDSSKVQKINKDDNPDIEYFFRYGAVTEDLKDIKIEIVKYLIKNNVDINKKDKNNNTALMLIKNIDFDHINFIYDKDGYIYLDLDDKLLSKYYFKKYNEVEIAKLLIDNGASFNINNKLGYTPLMIYSSKGQIPLVEYLLEQGANINTKIEVTASSLAQNEEIKEMIDDSKNNNPQRLVKLLSNFTKETPIKFTTHNEFEQFIPLINKEFGSFDGYMDAVKKQFDSMKSDLEELSPNLYKKIYTFLLETTPDENYSWCSKTDINIGWSSLDGLKEHCDSGENPFSFRLPKAISYKVGFKTIKITTFEEVINLFKQEIEIRENFKNLSTLFINQQKRLDESFALDLSSAKLGRQFYTDTQKFSSVLDKIFTDMGTRKEYPNITVTTTELEDRSIELKITQHDSNSSRSADELLERVKEAGDIAQIKESLTNLCDWSVESSYDGDYFRVNFLHSNNVKEIVPLETKPDGFTHVLRFYK